MRKQLALVAGLIVLVVANYTIYRREQLLTDGRVVLLQLAPVDPRSLMQGDYMALRFQAANDAFGFGDVKESMQDGYLVLALDTHRVGRFRRFDDGSRLAENEVRMRYRIRNRRPQFGTNAFFFQEGEAELYTTARYGEFRVGPDGEAILTQLRDEEFKRLGRAETQALPVTMEAKRCDFGPCSVFSLALEGEGRGEGVFRRGSAVRHPHPHPLPEGEGTGQQ